MFENADFALPRAGLAMQSPASTQLKYFILLDDSY
jgi:hypothetical protein